MSFSFHLLRAPFAVGLALLAVGAARMKKSRPADIAPAAADSCAQGAQSRTDELAQLLRHLLTAGEEEKGRIARELHDGLGSSLTAVNMDLSWVKQRLADQPALATRLARAMEVLATTVEMKRRIIHDLRPTVLDNLGLGAAIESHAVEFSQTGKIAIETQLPDEMPALQAGAPIALFRIYQEALASAVGRGATSISVSLREDASSVALEISDNGSGAESAMTNGISPAVGLLGMRERAVAIGATLSAERSGHGTVVTATVPRADS